MADEQWRNAYRMAGGRAMSESDSEPPEPWMIEAVKRKKAQMEKESEGEGEKDCECDEACACDEEEEEER